MSAKRIRPGFWLVFWREFRWLGRRPLLLALATIIPILSFSAMSLVYYRGIKTNLPVAVLDLDDSDLSRRISRLVDATDSARVVAKVNSLYEGRHGIVSGHYYGLLLIPKHFMRDVMSGRRPEVSFFYNEQMLGAGNTAASAVSAALPQFSAEVQAAGRMARGVTSAQAAVAIQPIPLQSHGLFNPELNYNFFVLAALAVAVLQLTICMTAGYSVALDVQTPHRLRILRRLAGGIVPAVFAKLLPLAVIVLLIHAVCDIILFGPLQLPLRGSLAIIELGAVMFVLSCLALGAVLALLLKSPSATLSLQSLLVSPSFGYLGVSFPHSGMNKFSQTWANIFPADHYVPVRIDQTVRGAPLEFSVVFLRDQLLYLVIVGALLLLLLTLRKRSNDRPNGHVEAVGGAVEAGA